MDQDGFECMADVLLKLRRMPATFGEVPFVLRYEVKVDGSKMRLIRTVQNTLGVMVMRRFGR